MSPAKPKAAFVGNPKSIDWVYGLGRKQHVADRTQLCEAAIAVEDMAAHAEALADAEVLFSTWGCPEFNDDQLALLPKLGAVFYAAGSVQRFARPLLDRDIMLVSAWQANAVPVAEYTFAQIILANKGYFQNVRDCATFAGRKAGPFASLGNFERTVSILGAGAIGRIVIGMLKQLAVDVIVFDPFLSDDDAAAMGVTKVSLEDALARGDVVSNHLANNPQTVGMISADAMAKLKPEAVFINTGRGATVDEAGLADAMRQRPNAVALLDVTMPEPPEEDSPFYPLPNVHLTSHIAGSLGNEVVRMADYCIEEFDRWQANEPLRYRVTREMLETMA